MLCSGLRFSIHEQLLNYAVLVPNLNQSREANIYEKVTKMWNSCIRRNKVQGTSSILNTIHYNFQCPLSRFTYKMVYHCKATVAVTKHMFKTGRLDFLHHIDLYYTAKKDRFEKLTRYKLSALTT